MRLSILVPLFLTVAASVPRAKADPAAEITSFSLFKEVDMKKLAKGEVLSALSLIHI